MMSKDCPYCNSPHREAKIGYTEFTCGSIKYNDDFYAFSQSDICKRICELEKQFYNTIVKTVCEKCSTEFVVTGFFGTDRSLTFAMTQRCPNCSHHQPFWCQIKG